VTGYRATQANDIRSRFDTKIRLKPRIPEFGHAW
jgi:hypothetical protein